MTAIKPQSQDGDPRVATGLEQLGIKYELDRDGDFGICANLENGRTQMGSIKSRTFEFGEEELRDIYSVGLKSVGPFDARTANFLLEHNGTVKVGAWSTLHDNSNNYLAIFSAKIAADLTGEPLAGAIIAVLSAADEVEQRLFGSDDF